MNEAAKLDPCGAVVAAALRGWIDPAAVWAAAVRWAGAGGRVSTEELLGPLLGPERIEALGGAAPDPLASGVVAFTTMLCSGADVRLRAPRGDGGDAGAAGRPVTPPPGGVGPRYLLGERLGEGGAGRVVAGVQRRRAARRSLTAGGRPPTPGHPRAE